MVKIFSIIGIKKWEKIIDFFKDLVKSENYSRNQIINIDEVPLVFDCPPNRTFDINVHQIVTTSRESTNIMVVLA